MWSAYEPMITNAVVLESISEARKWEGVHLYLDVPDNDSKKGKKFLTCIDDLSRTASAELEYRVLFRATDDNPTIAVGLRDHVGHYAMEVGIDRSYNGYGGILDQKTWNKTGRAEIKANFAIKKDEYNVMNIKLKTPFGPNAGGTAPINEVEFMINGITSSTKKNFANDDLPHVARYLYYHNHTFEKIEVLEHHFRYTGIFDGCAQDQFDTRYHVLSYDNLFQMSVGGYVVIRGTYKEIVKSIKGVGLHAQTEDKQAKRTLHHTKEVKDILTITVLAINNAILVELMQDRHRMKLSYYGGYFGLGVTNIDLLDVEFRPGLPPA